MKWRRLMGAPSSGLGPHITTPLRKNAAVHHSKNCALMSQMGHERPKGYVCVESGLPPRSDIRRRGWHDRFVPKAAASRCSKLHRYSITSSTCASKIGESDSPSACAVLLLTVT